MACWIPGVLSIGFYRRLEFRSLPLGPSACARSFPADSVQWRYSTTWFYKATGRSWQDQDPLYMPDPKSQNFRKFYPDPLRPIFIRKPDQASSLGSGRRISLFFFPHIWPKKMDVNYSRVSVVHVNKFNLFNSHLWWQISIRDSLVGPISTRKRG